MLIDIPIELVSEVHKLIQEKSNKNNKLEVFVDGSYSAVYPNIAGWAFTVIDENGNEVLSKYDKIPTTNNQISGELKAAEEAIAYAIENSYKAIIINHDYIGISAVADNTWTKLKDLSMIAYRDYIHSVRNNIEIYFKYVQKKNKSNPADKYAKMAIMGE